MSPQSFRGHGGGSLSCSRARCRHDAREPRRGKHSAKLEARALPDRVSSPLHNAAYNANVIEARALLESGTPVDGVTCDGETPLHLAATMASDQMAALLCAYRADINARDQHGDTPLTKSCARSSVTGLLISRGARVDLPNNWGDQPIHAAAFRGLPAVLEVLCGARASVDAVGKVRACRKQKEAIPRSPARAHLTAKEETSRAPVCDRAWPLGVVALARSQEAGLAILCRDARRPSRSLRCEATWTQCGACSHTAQLLGR
jgi:hypothetical protein